MPKSAAAKSPKDKLEIESGHEKRLANILKKALNTPPPHRQAGAAAPVVRKPKK